MGNYKRARGSLYLFFLLPFLMSCSVLVPTKYDYNLKKAQISTELDDYSGIGHEYTTFIDSDIPIIVFNFELDGRNTFMKVDVKKKSELKMIYDFKNVSGKLTIVATDNKKWVQKIITLDNEDKKENITLDLDEGNYDVKAIADNAKFDMNIDLNYSLDDMDILYTSRN